MPPLFSTAVFRFNGASAESDFSIYLDQIATATTKQMSAPSLLDKIVVVNREKGSEGIEVLRQCIAAAGIQVVEFTEEGQALRAFDAHLRFGKGMVIRPN